MKIVLKSLLIMVFVFSNSVFALSKSDATKTLQCSKGTLEDGGGGGPAKKKFYCKVTTTTQESRTHFREAHCPSFAGIGYFLKKNNGSWSCCGTNPAGETCKSNIIKCKKEKFDGSDRNGNLRTSGSVDKGETCEYKYNINISTDDYVAPTLN